MTLTTLEEYDACAKTGKSGETVALTHDLLRQVVARATQAAPSITQRDGVEIRRDVVLVHLRNQNLALDLRAIDRTVRYILDGTTPEPESE